MIIIIITTSSIQPPFIYDKLLDKNLLFKKLPIVEEKNVRNSAFRLNNLGFFTEQEKEVMSCHSTGKKILKGLFTQS